jgi:hypothetical protein
MKKFWKENYMSELTNQSIKNNLIVEVCEFVVDFFNIKSQNKIMDILIMQIAETIVNNNNISDYVKFIKSNLKNQKYNYLTNIQKFELMSEDYLCSFAKLKNEELYKCNEFAEKLRKKIFDFFDYVNFEIQVQNQKIENLKINNYFDNLEMRIINEIGGKEKVFNLNNLNKDLLSELILEKVIKMKIEKNKKEYLLKNNKNINLIERLKNGKSN